MKFTWTGFTLSWIIITALIFGYNGIYVVKPGSIALIQHHNGEVEVEKMIGYHWTMGKVMHMPETITMRTDGLGGTLYEGKETVGEHFDLSSPNKNLVRIK